MPLIILSHTCLLCLLVLLLAAAGGEAKLRPPEAVNTSVFERGLVRKDTSWRDISRAHHRYHEETHVRRFKGPVLGYVTPWNAQGYDVAKTFRSKFTHISPVWFQLKSSATGSYHLTGGHDVDAGWLAALRSRDAPGKPPKIVPRVLFELVPQETAGALLDGAQPVAALLAAEAKQHGFDGWMVEMWSQWAGLGMARSPPLRKRVHAFVQELGTKLQAAELELILAVPPALPSHPQGPAFTPEDWAAMRGNIAGVSVMTYDHALTGPGPNAPLPWVAANLQALAGGGSGEAARSLFVGLNMYGMDWALGGQPAAEPLLGRQAVELLRRHRPRLQWQPEEAEHSFDYVTNGCGHRAFYPTLASLQARLQLAAEQGAGIALWEVGQGLHYFMDLL